MSFALTLSLSLSHNNTRKVASFIDNILVETEKEEGHNEVMEKIVRKLVEKNLYIKLKKCK